jgi:dGTP triphosphohydrolase
MRKKSSIQLSYPVSDDEKQKANICLRYFRNAKKQLDYSVNELNDMYVPFKEKGDIPAEDILKQRSVLRAFRDKTVDNFNKFKIAAFEAINSLKPFMFDVQVKKSSSAFISSIEELQKIVNLFVDEFEVLESVEFTKNISKYIEDIQNKAKSISNLIDDRVFPIIKDNILSETWLDDVGKNLNKKIEKEVPVLLQLYKQREEELKKV